MGPIRHGRAKTIHASKAATQRSPPGPPNAGTEYLAPATALAALRLDFTLWLH